MSVPMSENMFAAVESTWNDSSRRRWTTLASFALQAVGLILLGVISLILVDGPSPVHWLRISVPAAFIPPTETHTIAGTRHSTTSADNPRHQFFAPQSIPLHIATGNGSDPAPAAPDLQSIGADRGQGSSDPVVRGLSSNFLGSYFPVVIPARPATGRPLVVSHLSEANLLYKLQPVYPALARQARVEGIVELRAIISKKGTIENLVVVRGHPLLTQGAIAAVRQWRYRPYLLNNEPVEVETEITVSFVLSGG